MTQTQLLSFLKSKISSKIKPGERVILGLSGGPDSVFLLQVLTELGGRVETTACHVNYHLRAEASNEDQKFVEELCAGENIKLEVLEADQNNSKGNLEENCRDVRYEFFEKMRIKHKATFILIAHNLNDQIETFLLNMMRGSSLYGFRAMQEYDSQRKIYRPLLSTSKEDIKMFLDEHNIAYRTDASNLSTIYSRNKVRLQVIPELEKVVPGFMKTMALGLNDFNQNILLIEDLLTNWYQENVETKGQTLQFSLKSFLHESEIFQFHLIRYIYIKVQGKSLARKTINEILKTLHKNSAGLKKEFGPGKIMQIEKDANNKRLVIIKNG